MRAGVHALSILAEPLCIKVLTSLRDEPLPFKELSREVGSPQTTTRAHLRMLIEAQVLSRRRNEARPGSFAYDLTASGHELVEVAEVLSTWLARSPTRPVSLGSGDAKVVVKAMLDAWSSTILRVLAAKPLGITELDSLIGGLSYPALERRLASLRRTGQIEPCPIIDRTPYTVTVWLREAIAPVVSAIHWERSRLSSTTTPITRLDVETAFLLVVPMISLRSDLSGLCSLTVEIENRGRIRMAGVTVEVEEGRVASWTSRLVGKPDASASGSDQAWLEAVMAHHPERIRASGRRELAVSVMTGLRHFLFAPPGRPGHSR